MFCFSLPIDDENLELLIFVNMTLAVIVAFNKALFCRVDSINVIDEFKVTFNPLSVGNEVKLTSFVLGRSVVTLCVED